MLTRMEGQLQRVEAQQQDAIKTVQEFARETQRRDRPRCPHGTAVLPKVPTNPTHGGEGISQMEQLT